MDPDADDRSETARFWAQFFDDHSKEIKVDAEALCKRWMICGRIVCAHRSRDFAYFRASIRIISVV